MNAIITVIGKDRVGIIAEIAVKLAEYGINILDISQTVMQGNFTMVMSVDMTLCTCGFGTVTQVLNDLGDKMGVSVRIQRTEIFDAMHTI